MVLGLHSLCCGLPALAITLTALGLSGLSLGGSVIGLHRLIHGHELWILALSATLVGVGGVMEFEARRKHEESGIPWLFILSAGCFAANVAIIAGHRFLAG